MRFPGFMRSSSPDFPSRCRRPTARRGGDDLNIVTAGTSDNGLDRSRCTLSSLHVACNSSAHVHVHQMKKIPKKGNRSPRQFIWMAAENGKITTAIVCLFDDKQGLPTVKQKLVFRLQVAFPVSALPGRLNRPPIQRVAMYDMVRHAYACRRRMNAIGQPKSSHLVVSRHGLNLTITSPRCTCARLSPVSHREKISLLIHM